MSLPMSISDCSKLLSNWPQWFQIININLRMRLFELAGIIDAKGRNIIKALCSIKGRLPIARPHDKHSNGPSSHEHPEYKQREWPSNLSTGFLFSLPKFIQVFKRHAHGKSAPVIHPPPFDNMTHPPDRSSSGKAFTYAVVGAGGVLSAMAAKSTIIDFLSSLSAAGSVLALAQVEVDLSTIPEGKNVVVKWRGKPIFIRHRTAEEIREAEEVPLNELRDPQKDSDRVQKPEWLVMLGICTHLGCVPIGESGDFGGWYCPCQ
jgi:ubiquinol-cytochrome c reductase iron-sulfur subunit